MTTKDRCWKFYSHINPRGARGVGKIFRERDDGGDIVRKSDFEALIKSISKLAEYGNSFSAFKSPKDIIIDS